MRSAKFLVCCKSELNHKSYPRRDGGKETGKTRGQARSQKGKNENNETNADRFIVSHLFIIYVLDA